MQSIIPDHSSHHQLYTPGVVLNAANFCALYGGGFPISVIATVPGDISQFSSLGYKRWDGEVGSVFNKNNQRKRSRITHKEKNLCRKKVSLKAKIKKISQGNIKRRSSFLT